MLPLAASPGLHTHRCPARVQWLERARDALRREVADIQQQHVALAAGLQSAVVAAAAVPQSPQKALAAQVGRGTLAG